MTPQGTLPRPVSALWRSLPTALMLGGLGLSATAQSLGPAELAAQALATAPVRALMSTQAPSTRAVPSAAERQAQEHEAQLAAIRQAILDATLERPTRVISSAWVDDKGALHESAHFHSEAQVRGVRVLSYLNDEQTQPAVSAEVLPWGWKPQGPNQGCQAPPRPWRLPLLVQTVAPSGFSGAQQFASQTLLDMAQQAWTQHMQSSQRWRAQPLLSPPDSAYLRALTGQMHAPSGWRAELSLHPHAPVVPRTWMQGLNPLPPAPSWRWTLRLSLSQHHTPSDHTEPQWQIEQVIALDPVAMAQQPSAWTQQLHNQLQQHMQRWVAHLDQRTECEPVQFHVRREAGQPLQLQAGQGSGLRPGDRVLLMNPSHVPSRMLEPGVAQHLALAQVVKVGPHHTELQPLAGPALTSPGPWMALPL